MINAKGDLNIYKATGKVSALEEKCANEDTTGTIGIAHTRWATHGEPNTVNAHPHLSQSGNLSLVHNGIIENYKTLRAMLEKEGYTFCSDTDTEVLVQLIEYTQKKGKCDLFTAVQRALKNVVGAYAIAILQKEHPDQLICARKGSPLVIGVGTDARGQKEFYLGSDATPIVEYTKQVIYLKDEEIAYMDRSGKIDIVNLSNVHQTPEMHTLSLSLDELEKGGFPHFMLKEIWEQPNALRTCIKGRLHPKDKDVVLSGIIDHKDKFINARRIIICACGTSWHSALIGKYFIEEAAQIPVEVEYASEFRYRNPVIYPDDVVIAVSQSGETADTLAAIQLAEQKGAFLYGICNVIGSSIARATNSGTYLHVGPEIGVASTKAFTGQVITLCLLGLAIAKEKHTLSDDMFHMLVDELYQIPDKIQWTLENNKNIDQFAQMFTYCRNFIFLGRGYNYPVALEGALKLKEISLPPRRRLPRRRNEARPHRPRRRGDARGLHRPQARHVRQDCQQHPGNQEPQGQDYLRGHRRRHDGEEHERLLLRHPRHTRLLRAPAFGHPAAAAGLLHCHRQGPQRRPAAQPGQERYR